jgi:hypothetical protein
MNLRGYSAGKDFAALERPLLARCFCCNTVYGKEMLSPTGGSIYNLICEIKVHGRAGRLPTAPPEFALLRALFVQYQPFTYRIRRAAMQVKIEGGTC